MLLMFPAIKSFIVSIQIMFDNRAHSGKIKVDVKNDVTIYECRDWNVEGTCKFVHPIFLKKYSHLPLLQEASRRGAHSPEICASVFSSREARLPAHNV